MKPSAKNTTTGSNAPEIAPEPSVDDVLTGDDTDAVADKTAVANANLGETLEGVKDARCEERFVWIVVVVILVDVLWFKDSTNPTLPLVVLVLQLVVLLILARKMGIDDVVTLINKLLHSVGNKAGNGA